jgi:hypothetical protein
MEASRKFIREGQEGRGKAENRADYRWNIKPILGGKHPNPNPDMAKIIETSPLPMYVDATLTRIKTGGRWGCLLCEQRPNIPPALLLITLVKATNPATGGDEAAPVASFLYRDCRASYPHDELKIKVRKTIEADLTVTWSVSPYSTPKGAAGTKKLTHGSKYSQIARPVLDRYREPAAPEETR